MNMDNLSLFELARQCLLEPEVEQTLAITESVTAAGNGLMVIDSKSTPAVDDDLRPVFPPRPELVDPAELPGRGMGTEQGRAALVHAIAHIEYNAVHLAWDAVYRFRDMPADFYHDWMRVAGEECRHFRLLLQRLHIMGYDYGDFAAHDGLWRIAYKTRHDPLLRMALVPRVLEARGLDVTPAMIEGLEKVEDHETADILRVIYEEEIGHVEIGTRWFRYLCQQRHSDPDTTFYRVVKEHYRGGLRGPYNDEARLAAGFSQNELDWLNR